MTYIRYPHKNRKEKRNLKKNHQKSGTAAGANNRRTGGYYERLAAEFLEQKGLRIVEYNYRCRMGEIDLIAREGQCLVFVEVKYRRDGGCGCALEAVDCRKQRVISTVATHYLVTHCGSTEVLCRFDVIGIDGDGIHWIRNAFDCV